MLLNKIWARHFYSQVIQLFLFIIVCFYGIYVLIDYASHSRSFHSDWNVILNHYLIEFIQRMDVLIPFALLIATIRTLCRLNHFNELVALRASGVPLKTLLRPFVIFGFCCTLLLMINNEYFLPKGIEKLKELSSKHEKAKHKDRERTAIQQLLLDDGTVVIYSSYKQPERLFMDAYWIKSINEIYHMQSLSHEITPIGLHVDVIKRNPQGEFILAQTFANRSFPEMRFNQKRLIANIAQPDEESISTLWNKLSITAQEMTEKQCQVSSCFFHKLILPWICLLAVIGPAPFCVHFSRQLPIFFIYACSIFGLVALYLVMDAGLVLGKRQVLSPLIAVCAPFALVSATFVWRYCKLK